MNSACFYPLRQRFDEESFRFGLRIVKTVGSDTFEPRKTPVQQRSTVTVEAISEATIQVLLAVGLDRLTATRVAAPAIPKCTNHLYVLKIVREPEFKPTCFIEGLQMFGGKGQDRNWRYRPGVGTPSVLERSG